MPVAVAQASGIYLPFSTGYFHSIITSPPYYGLREYHGEQVVDWPGLLDEREQDHHEYYELFGTGRV